MCSKDAVASPKATPFPYKAVFILVACQLIEPITIAVLFPIAPFMVADWVPIDEVGSWAGLLTSAFNLAAIPAGVFWGRLSDKVGRKPCIVALEIGSALCLIAVGLSSSLTHALAARFAGGLFGGIGGIVMASIREVAGPEHRSRAVASVSFAYGVGFAIGPLIGGGLSRPADTVPALRGGLFDTFPYLLPCLLGALLIVSSGIGLCWLPLPRQPSSPKCTPPATATSSTAAPAAAADAAANADGGDAPAPEAAADESDGRRLFSGPGSGGSEGGAAAGDAARRFALLAACWRGAREPIVVLLCAYLLLNFGMIGSMETLPLFLMRNDTSGLSMPPAQVGEVLLPQSAAVLCMPLLYPRVARRFGDRGTFLVGAMGLFAFSLGLPPLRALKASHPAAMWLVLTALSALRGVAGPFCFPAMLIIINRVVTRRFGFWNGLASSVASCARAAAPSVFGHLFAVCTKAGHLPFPLDVSAPFALCAASVAIAAALVFAATQRPGRPAASPSLLWTRLSRSCCGLVLGGLVGRAARTTPARHAAPVVPTPPAVQLEGGVV